MTKIYYDHSKTTKLILENLTIVLEKMKNCKDYSNEIVAVPYDFKYRDYVLNLKVANKLDYDAINKIEDFVIKSCNKFSKAEENLTNDLIDIDNYVISPRKSVIK